MDGMGWHELNTVSVVPYGSSWDGWSYSRPFAKWFNSEGLECPVPQGYSIHVLNLILVDVNIEEELDYIGKNPSAFVYIGEFKDHGIVYRFNFRVKDSLYAPVYRGYFMKRFKELMEEEGNSIVTPSKLEIKNIGDWKEFRW